MLREAQYVGWKCLEHELRYVTRLYPGRAETHVYLTCGQFGAAAQL